MLRLLVVLLLFANGLYFAWSQGHLASLGLAPHNPSEPLRVQNQLKPEAVKLLSAAELKQLERPASSATTQCMYSEVMKPADADTLRQRIEASTPPWPTGSWQLEAHSEAASWMIYMGPYPGQELQDKKKQELKRLNVGFEPIHPKTLGVGLLLAASTHKASLEAKLVDLNRTGVRTARVLPLREAASGQVLKLPAYHEGMAALVQGIQSALPNIDGHPLRPCPP